MEYPIYKKLREKFNGSNAMFLNKATCAAIADFMSTFIEIKCNELLTQDATEYLMSSKLNMERINSAIKDFEKHGDEEEQLALKESYLEGEEAEFPFSSCMEDEFPIDELEEQLEKSIKDFEKSDVTPLALLTLGFEEVYQKPDMAKNYITAGYIYYSLSIAGIHFLSTSIDEPDFFVYLEDNTRITSIESLSNLVTSLREL